MKQSLLERRLLPILAALAFLSPVPSQAFIQGRYTSDPSDHSVPVLPTAANGPDLPTFGAVSEGELGFPKSCRNDPVSFNDPMGLDPLTPAWMHRKLSKVYHFFGANENAKWHADMAVWDSSGNQMGSGRINLPAFFNPVIANDLRKEPLPQWFVEDQVALRGVQANTMLAGEGAFVLTAGTVAGAPVAAEGLVTLKGSVASALALEELSHGGVFIWMHRVMPAFLKAGAALTTAFGATQIDRVYVDTPCGPDPVQFVPTRQPPQLERGKAAHIAEPIRPGEIPEYRIPGTGRRIDRYDPVKLHIREIKPANQEELQRGNDQVENYRVLMEEIYGKPHTIEVSPYDPAIYE